MWIDARIPVRFGDLHTRSDAEAVLTDMRPSGPGAWGYIPAAASYAVDCTCCTPRNAAAVALGALFRNRAMGTGTPFRGVLAAVGPQAEAMVRAALENDPVVVARFRATPPQSVDDPRTTVSVRCSGT